MQVALFDSRSPSIVQRLYTYLQCHGLYWLLVLAALLGAVLFGLIASTGHIFLVAMSVGMFLGCYAFISPSFTIWFILICGLFFAGLVPIWAQGLGAKMVWGISLLGFVLLLSVLLNVCLNTRITRQTPLFVWLALVFIGYSLFNGIFQSSAYELASGFKRYFQVTALCFAFCWLSFSPKTLQNWKLLFVVLAVAQLPWAAYELFSLVPLRQALKYAYPGMIPIDVVSGTFGASRFGGGANAEMAFFLLVVLAFAVARWKEQVNPKSHLLLIISLALIPLFMGETKVVVVFVPIIFLTLFAQDLFKSPVWAIGGIIFSILFTLGTAYTYLQLVEAQTLSEMFASTIEYNLQDKGYGSNYLNRLTSVSFWFSEQGAQNPSAIFFGNGIGSAHEATGGSVSLHYPGYGIDLTTIAVLLWEQGLIGLAIFYGIFISAWFAATKLQEVAINKENKADAAAIKACLSVLLIYPIYRSTMLEALPFQILFWSLLGYLAFLYKSHYSELIKK